MRASILLIFLLCQLAAAAQSTSVYPSIRTADSTTMVLVTTDYVQAMLTAANKTHNTRLGDLYASRTGQNLLSKTLIEHHLDSSVTLGQFSARIQQLHISIPGMPVYHSAAPRVAVPH
jgi:hypothetical protein